MSMATRFAEVSEEDVTILVNERVPQITKQATSYVVKAFEIFEVRKLLIGVFDLHLVGFDCF